MLVRFIAAFCLLLTPTMPAPASGSAASPTPPLLYTVTKSYEPLAWLHGADRFGVGTAIYFKQGSKQRPLLPSFAASADPAVSFDGQRVLFAGKAHAQDPWQVWEVSLSEGKPRRITSGNDDCVRPFYLPDDRIVYARKTNGRFVIETSDLMGASPFPLTYISSNALPTDILRDGRILFQSSYPLGTDGLPELYTVYSDGSGVESYRCDHRGARHSGRQDKSGDIVFASAHGLARFTSARAQEVPITAPAGEYDEVVETESNGWIVTWRPDAKTTFRLVRWMPGSRDLEPFFTEPGTNIVQPTLVMEHALPNRHPSALHDWPNANLLCLNAYTSKYQFIPGSIHTVRMYVRDAEGATKLLGSASVERDGSFFVQVPTEQPIQIELLDATGKTLKRESGFYWMRRGEQRGCVGCHAGPETAPENAVPMILLKSTTPADMTGALAQSAGGH